MLGRQYRLSLILTPNWSALIYFGIRLKFLTVLLLFDVQFEGGRSTLLTVWMILHLHWLPTSHRQHICDKT